MRVFTFLHKHVLKNPVLKQKVEAYELKENSVFVFKNTKILTRELSYIRNPLSEFLTNCFKFWPPNLPFPLHYVVEIWLLHINTAELDSLKWYIFSNWTFYSNIFDSFLDFVHSSNLLISGNTHEILLIDKITSFFVKEKIKEHFDNFENIKFNISSTDDQIENSNIFCVISPSNKSKAEDLISLIQDLLKNISKYERILKKNGLNKESLTRLEHIGINLKNLFKIEKVDVNKSYLIFEEEDKNVWAETEGSTLTQKGREDLKLGKKKVNKRNIPYIGNELYKPNSTFEIPVLVDFTIWLSDILNEYFKTEAINLRFMSTYQFLFIFGIFVTIFFIFYLILSLIRGY